MSSTDIYLCFCCLSTDDLFSLFNSDSADNYAAMLKEICKIDPTREEYPHDSYICSICISKLQDAVNFKRQVWETLAVLKKNGLIQLSNLDEKKPAGDVTDEDDPLYEQYEELLSETDENLKDVEGRPKNKITADTSRDEDLERTDPQTESDDSMQSSDTTDILLTHFDSASAIKTITNSIPPLNIEPKYEEGAEKPYKCTICEKRIKTKSMFKFHMMRHNGVKRFACGYCDKGFLFKDDLRAHIRAHTGEKPFKCKVCGKRCTQSTHLNTHMKEVHYRERSECSICHTQVTWRYLKRHMLRCGKNKQYDCKVCGKTFTCQGYLVRHLRSHDGRKRYKCAICEKRFAMKSYLRQHSKTNCGEKTFACHICKKGFSTSAKLTDHIIKHDGETPFKCRTCDEEFPTKETLYSHIKTHEESEKVHKCILCEKAYTHRYQLTRHIEKVHTEPTSFQCNHCMDIFTEREDLIEHLKTHAGEKAHKCEICGIRFSFKQTWQRHVDMHSKEFYCHICNKTLGNRGKFAEHMKIHSTEEPKFQCQICKKEFLRVSYLQNHIETHSKKKLYNSVKFIRKISS